MAQDKEPILPRKSKIALLTDVFGGGRWSANKYLLQVNYKKSGTIFEPIPYHQLRHQKNANVYSYRKGARKIG